MKKIINLSLIGILAGVVLTGCSGKNEMLNTEGYKEVQMFKKGNSYVLKPIQYVQGTAITGSYTVGEDSQPILVNAKNCNFVVSAKKETSINAQMKIDSMSCDIKGDLLSSNSIEGWILQGDYNGMKLDETKVKQGEIENSYYGIKPGQEIKLFIKEGTLNQLN